VRKISSVMALAAVLAPALAAQRAAASVDVYPLAGSRVASPATQISFRGATAAQLRHVTVTGSRSRRHSFSVKAHSDGHGASVLPRRPFRSGELVTVRAPGLPLTGAAKGVLRFRVARLVHGKPIAFPDPAGNPKSPLHMHTDHSLRPPRLVIHRAIAAPSGEKLFLAPKGGAGQDGPEIFDEAGRIVWFRRVPTGLSAFDFRTQEYLGRRVLTWWQGKVVLPGAGLGEGLIFDDAYRLVARVRTGNGYASDLHEFQVTPAGSAYLLAYQPTVWRGAVVMDCIVQEIDVRTGLVELEWHSLDHVPVADSFFRPVPHMPFDYVHINAVEPEPDGTLLISGRNTSTIYSVDPHSGRILWRLNGKHSDFKMGPGASFIAQHDARRLPDGTLTVFDNGSPPVTKRPARGIVLALDTAAKTATLVRSFVHSPSFRAGNQGSIQALADGNYLFAWGGGHSWVSESGPTGNVVFDAQITPSSNDTYRAFRLPWSGQPVTPPTAVASSSNGATAVFAAWNGATDVASWRVLAGDSRAALAPAAAAAWTDVETEIGFGGRPRFVRVQALNAAGRVIGTSAIVTPRRH
jgi:Arylsulfotransferase (ASST)